ncbi:MAG: DMT family transporter [Spirochaetales bacterium]|nr:DMT family transporter [Spirochaetales bacterium]
MKRHTPSGYVYALVSAMLLSTTGIFIQTLTMKGWEALPLAVWRAFIAGTVLVALSGWVSTETWRISWKQWGRLLQTGFALALFNGLWTYSVVINGAGRATILVYSSTGFALLLDWLWEKIDCSLMKLLAAVLVFIGCLFAMDGRELGFHSWGGLALGMVSGLAYALYSRQVRQATLNGLSVWQITGWSFVFSGMGLLIVWVCVGGSVPLCPEVGGSSWGLLCLLALGPTLAGFACYSQGLKFLPAGTVNTLAATEPFFTVMMECWLFALPFSFQILMSAVFVMGGVVFLHQSENRNTQGPAWKKSSPPRRRRGRSQF